MENDTTNTPAEKLPKGDQKITTPVAIVVAGVLIAVAILLTRGVGNNTEKVKPFSVQVGVSKTALDACIAGTDLDKLYVEAASEANIVMKDIPANQRGTPYIVLVGKDGTKVELRGNIPYDDYYPSKESTIKSQGAKSIIDNMLAGKAISNYNGEIPPPSKDDHIMGSSEASIIIVEYSDLECPYCKEFGITAKKIVDESNGQVAWIYRDWIVHSGALTKAGAAECIAKLKGNDTYWKYIDLIFSLVKTQKDLENEMLEKL